jgi:hypothetical protein
MGCLLPLIGVPLALMTVAFGLMALVSIPDPNSKATSANASKLRVGMTYDQVVAILGDPVPPGPDGPMQAELCRQGSDLCSWAPCPLCDVSVQVEFQRGVMVGKTVHDR